MISKVEERGGLRDFDLETQCVHGAADKNNSTGAITGPVYQTATFAHPGPGETSGYDYARLQNPTREVLEKTVALLEGGADCMAFSSGMAAMALLTELLAPGDHMLTSADLYGGSVRLLAHVTRKNGVDVESLPIGDTSDLAAQIRENTRCVFLETPSNPMMQTADIAAAARVCKARGVLLAVDNTFFTPVYQRPLTLGADIVLHSGTKYLGGHNDVLAGFLITKTPELGEKLRFLYKTTGSCLAPWDAFLLQRGIMTLALRMERITQNATQIAGWLAAHKKIKKVLYPGKSGMITFETDSEETARRVLSRITIVRFAESLGGVQSLMTYPILQTHADVPEATRTALGIHARLLRLSVGIESIADLLWDLGQALA
jgi:cystathionine beta-lyase/cystathionine gamma-synthase